MKTLRSILLAVLFMLGSFAHAQEDTIFSSIFNDSLVQSITQSVNQNNSVLQIEEQTVVKYGAVSQVYMRFTAPPPPGTILEFSSGGQITNSFPLNDVNIVCDIATGAQYTLTINGQVIDEIDTRIMGAKEQINVTQAMMASLVFDTAFVGGTKSILTTMDENANISYFEKLALLQNHYLQGLPLSSDYYVSPSEAAMDGYFKDIEPIIIFPLDPPSDPFGIGDGLDSISIGIDPDFNGNPPHAWMLGPGAPTTKPNGTIINIGLNGNNVWLIAKDGVWVSFDPDRDCQYSLILKKRSYLTNVDLDKKATKVNSPYEHFNLGINGVDANSTENTSDGMYKTEKMLAVKGASVGKFMKNHGYPRSFRGRPRNKVFSHGQLDPENSQVQFYNLLSSTGWFAKPCACEKNLSVRFRYNGEFKVNTKTRLNPGRSYSRSAYAHATDNAFGAAVNLKTGDITSAGAGMREIDMSCSQALSATWKKGLNDAVTGYVNTATELLLIAGAGSINPALIPKLKLTGPGQMASGLVTLYTNDRFDWAGHCGPKPETYVLMDKIIQVILRPNEGVMLAISSAQKIELKGDSHWESSVEIQSAAFISAYFHPQGQASYPGGPTCCSVPFAQWIQTGFGADNFGKDREENNLDLIAAYLDVQALWQPKYLSGPFNHLTSFGNIGAARGFLQIGCTNPINLRQATAQEQIAQHGTTVRHFANSVKIDFPESFIGDKLEIRSITGQTLYELPIDNETLTLNLEQLPVARGIMLIGVKGKSRYHKISKMN